MTGRYGVGYIDTARGASSHHAEKAHGDQRSPLVAVLAQHDANTEQRAAGPRSSMPKMLENLVSHRHNFTDGPCYDRQTRGHVYFKADRHA